MDGSRRDSEESRKRTFISARTRKRPRQDSSDTRDTRLGSIVTNLIDTSNTSEQQKEQTFGLVGDDDDDISPGSSSDSLAEAGSRKRTKRHGPKGRRAKRASCEEPSPGCGPKAEIFLDKNWCQYFAPTQPKDLGVHPKKVDDVRNWLKKALAGSSGPQLLVLKGPSGSGKSTLVTTLVQEFEAQVLQLRSDSDLVGFVKPHDTSSTSTTDILVDMRYADRLNVDQLHKLNDTKAYENSCEPRRTILLLEDADNVLAQGGTYAARLRATIDRYLLLPFYEEVKERHSPGHSLRSVIPPMIMVLTESAGMTTEGRPSWYLGEIIIKHPRTTLIELNKPAQTILQKVLTRIVERVRNHYSHADYMMLKSFCTELAVSGNIRNAINGLQFRARPLRHALSESTATSQGPDLLQVDTSLSLFHTAGKVLYNKRAKETQDPGKKGSIGRDNALDFAGYAEHRPTPPIEEIARIAESDSVLFVSTLYENYLLSCETRQQALDVACMMSMADTFFHAREHGRENRQAASRGSHSTADSSLSSALGLDVAIRGTMHALPWPVVRKAPSEGPRPHLIKYPEIERVLISMIRKKFDHGDPQRSSGSVISSSGSQLHGLPHNRHILNESEIRADAHERTKDGPNRERSVLGRNDSKWIERDTIADRRASAGNQSLDDDIEDIV